MTRYLNFHLCFKSLPLPTEPHGSISAGIHVLSSDIVKTEQLISMYREQQVSLLLSEMFCLSFDTSFFAKVKNISTLLIYF